jgi:AraC family transcriptional regulator, regulatory protein of adaptative response / methylphosphotriester-DNA alkyltransferase methyltransferase
MELMTSEKWQAIISNDESYNDQFFYAVKTTGIFCRPSCKSRVPKRDNVLIFKHAEDALLANFRPCKRCKPTGQRLPEQEWIAHLIQYIDEHYQEKITLATLAEVGHSSPFHLQRIFKKINGMTPTEYIQNVRVNKAKDILVTTNKSVAEIAADVGILNTPYFITVFKKLTGHPPAEYRYLGVNKSC